MPSGQAVFAVELQEPTDFSIMLELKGFDLDPAGGELGLGRDLALSCVREKAFSASDMEGLQRHTAAGGPAEPGPCSTSSPPPPTLISEHNGSTGGARRPRTVVRCPRGACRRRVYAGRRLGGHGQAGNTFVVPWAAGPVVTTGEVELLRCLPPLADDARTDDPTA